MFVGAPHFKARSPSVSTDAEGDLAEMQVKKALRCYVTPKAGSSASTSSLVR